MKYFPNHSFKLTVTDLYEKIQYVLVVAYAYILMKILYIRIKIEHLINFEHISINLNCGNRKWLTIGLYKSPSLNESNFIHTLSLGLNGLSKTFENIIFWGDFDMTPNNKNMQQIPQAVTGGVP